MNSRVTRDDRVILYYRGPVFDSVSEKEMEILRQIHHREGPPRPETARWLKGSVHFPEVQGRVMHAHTYEAARHFATAPEPSDARTVPDVGGGTGTSAVSSGEKSPDIQVTILDPPAMEEPAGKSIRSRHVAGRVSLVGCDMFNGAWPDGVDAVYFSNIFHDLRPDRCRILAGRAYDVLASEAGSSRARCFSTTIAAARSRSPSSPQPCSSRWRGGRGPSQNRTACSRMPGSLVPSGYPSSATTRCSPALSRDATPPNMLPPRGARYG